MLWQQKVSLATTLRQKKFLLTIGALIAVQSVCLYSSVARLPVALALLAFNTYPLTTAFWARILYGHKAERAVLMAMQDGGLEALDVENLRRHYARTCATCA